MSDNFTQGKAEYCGIGERMREKLEAVRRLTEEQFKLLAQEFPELAKGGVTLFIGKHYACSDVVRRIMMLGINPGGEYSSFDTSLCEKNCLLDSEEGTSEPYWRKARNCFNVTPELSRILGQATFSFCSPFRTKRWPSKASEIDQRLAIEKYSAPILQQMLIDCKPTDVIVAGINTIWTFSRIANVNLSDQTDSVNYGRGAKCSKMIATADWGSFSLLQIPHFSYKYLANEAVINSGKWLSEMLTKSLDDQF